MSKTIGYEDNVKDSQTVVKTDFGEFKQEYLGSVYTMGESPDGRSQKYPVGVNMYLSFKADPSKVDNAREFGFMQQAFSQTDGKPYYAEEGHKDYSASDKTVIDQFPGMMNPLYATDSETKKGGANDIAGFKTTVPIHKAKKWGAESVGGEIKNRKWAGHGKFGSEYKEGTKQISKPATFQDTPHNLDYTKYGTLQNDFESTVLSFSGSDAGMYYGSVHWGFKVSEKKEKDPEDPKKEITTSVIDGDSISLKSMGKPTASFLKSVKAWNDSKKVGSKRENIIEIPEHAARISGDAPLYSTEADIDKDKSTEVCQNTPCMTFEQKVLGKDKKTFTRVRIEIDNKPLTGWVPSGSITNRQ